MWPFKKGREEILEQIVYDTVYKGVCPVCKTCSEESGHCTDFLGKHDSFASWLLIQCDNCHAAFYAAHGEVTKTLKKYTSDDKSMLGLKLVSEEVIK